MLKTSGFEVFVESDVLPYMNGLLMKIDSIFHEQKNMLKDEFIVSFKNICNLILQYQEKEKKEIAYLSFTLLRTKLLQKINTYDVSIYDSNWYLNDYVKIADYDVSYYYNPLDKIWDKLLSERKKYVGKVSELDVENIISAVFELFNQYIVHTMRYSILEAVECDEFKEVKKAPNFMAYVGELLGEPYIIYRETKDKKDLGILEENLIYGTPSHHLDLKNIDFWGFSMKETDLSYSDFRKSMMREVNFANSILIGTKFNECNLQNSKFMNTNITSVNFENANLEGVDFTYTFSKSVSNNTKVWEKASDLPINLKGANLRNAIFDNSAMIGADFTKSVIDGTSFFNTNLDRCCFTQSQANSLNLSHEQKKAIIIQSC